MTGLFQRSSRTGSGRSSEASDINVSSFKPAVDTGYTFAISIQFKTADTGHKMSLAIYGEEAHKFIEHLNGVNKTPQ